MSRGLAAVLLLALPAWAGPRPADPLGLDPGEARDEAAFTAWAADPRTAPMHPLEKFEHLVISNKKVRRDYYTFVARQAELSPAQLMATRALAEAVLARAPLSRLRPEGHEQAAEDAKLGAVVAARGKAFFAAVPREPRVRLYRIAEKFESARIAVLDLVRSGASCVSDSWLDETVAQDARRDDSYFAGALKGADAATRQAVLDDFRLTVEFMMTFTGPPPYIHGNKAKNGVRAWRRRRRAQILKALGPITP